MPCGIFYQFLGQFFWKKFLAKNCLAGGWKHFWKKLPSVQKGAFVFAKHPSVQKGDMKVRLQTPFCTEGRFRFCKTAFCTGGSLFFLTTHPRATGTICRRYFGFIGRPEPCLSCESPLSLLPLLAVFPCLHPREKEMQLGLVVTKWEIRSSAHPQTRQISIKSCLVCH